MDHDGPNVFAWGSIAFSWVSASGSRQNKGASPTQHMTGRFYVVKKKTGRFSFDFSLLKQICYTKRQILNKKRSHGI
jgi:hypothetical protein